MFPPRLFCNFSSGFSLVSTKSYGIICAAIGCCSGEVLAWLWLWMPTLHKFWSRLKSKTCPYNYKFVIFNNFGKLSPNKYWKTTTNLCRLICEGMT